MARGVAATDAGDQATEGPAGHDAAAAALLPPSAVTAAVLPAAVPGIDGQGSISGSAAAAVAAGCADGVSAGLADEEPRMAYSGAAACAAAAAGVLLRAPVFMVDL